MPYVEIPSNITREDILKAIQRIDREGVPANAHSSTYDVLFNNNRYPPKLLVSWANVYANGSEIDRASFAGGVNTPCFELLKSREFLIVDKIAQNGEVVNSMKKIFDTILNGWTKATSEAFAGHPISGLFRRDLKHNVEQLMQDIGVNYIVDASIGKGNWASVPWLAILDPRITRSTQNGIYPVYLFRADGSGFYLSLGFGTTSLIKELGIIDARKKVKDISARIRNYAPAVSLWSKDSIDLRSSTGTGRSYEWASVGAIFYSAGAVPSDEILHDDLIRLIGIYKSLPDDYFYDSGEKSIKPGVGVLHSKYSHIPKPFMLLAGISGTGKTRFVREQARKHNSGSNFCLVPVRPDWHEPSDLLGYISRIGGAPKYISTKTLEFIIQAWREIAPEADKNGMGALNMAAPPYWLCLDEMNLAPVEQYFADYLSVLESRKFDGDVYQCDPLLDKSLLLTRGIDCRSDLGLEDAEYDGLWEFFCRHGIPLPPNLIVAGTVNMDETTHGFSRKVIDRALTFDFGEFFPNDFQSVFKGQSLPKTLTYSLQTHASPENLPTSDPDGQLTIGFLESVNSILKQTPFELAYRALNELLLHVACFDPQDQASLQAVWDDFLMTKVLPRIDGDEDKLRLPGVGGADNVLEALEIKLAQLLDLIWTDDKGRKDLFREDHNGNEITGLPCRSRRKLAWMKKRLEANTFTSFWP